MMLFYRCTVIALLGSISWSGPVASESGGNSVPVIRIDLRPGGLVDGDIRAIDVTVSTDLAPIKKGERLATLPVVTNSLSTSASALSGFIVTDENGVVPTHVTDVTRTAAEIDRSWIADRPVKGRVTWRYRVAVDPATPPLRLPMYELRSSNATLSGAAVSFIVLPTDTTKRRLIIHWALDALPPGTIALSSFGRGDVVATDALDPGDIATTYYMVGAAGVFTAPGGGFAAGWQGRPRFDMTALMAWSAGLHRFYGDFFRDPKPVFGIFGRENPINPGSGVGLTNSFAFTFAQATRPADLRSMLAHEMLHVWVSSLDAIGDADPLSGSWFGEGLAVYYQRALPYRAGAITADEFLIDLNRTAIRYYTDAMIATPNDQIAVGFWKDTRVRVLPYDRGSLYFAGLNAEIRRASGGRRSLDDLVLALLAERRAGRSLTTDTWTVFLQRELGAVGLATWRAMLAGQRIDLPSDTFGACFVKQTKPVGEFDMGYDFVATSARGGVVQGVKRGSNAALAGLRNGDIVRAGGPKDVLQQDPHATVALQIERASQPLTIRYVPRGTILTVPQWVHRTDAPVSCRSSDHSPR